MKISKKEKKKVPVAGFSAVIYSFIPKLQRRHVNVERLASVPPMQQHHDSFVTGVDTQQEISDWDWLRGTSPRGVVPPLFSV